MEKHPELAAKFKLLYLLQLNPKIKSNAELARQLGLSKAAITRWCRGSPTSRGDAIPLDQVVTVANLFSIDPHWLSLPFKEFEAKARKKFSQENQQSKKKVRISTGTLPITDLNLFGRDKELKLLDKLWNDPNVNVVEIVAFGGAGKSALVNKWLSEMSKSNYQGAENVYAWSFYWQGQSVDVRSAGDYFIEHALEWFGDADPREGSLWARATRLARLIGETRTLLILDGLEPLQNLTNEKLGHIHDSAVSLLIKELAAVNCGKCLISTRYSVADLSSFYDGRIYSLALSRLPLQSGVELLVNKGLVGTSEEFEWAVQSYSGHALSLQLLAGYLAIVHNGQIRKLNYMESILEEKLGSNHVKNILNDYLEIFNGKPHLQILRIVSLLGKPVEVSNVRDLATTKCIIGFTDLLQELTIENWSYSINELNTANLISVKIHSNGKIIDCHPLVKDCVSQEFKETQAAAWSKSHALLYRFIESTVVENPTTVAEYEPLFKAAIHAVNAGKYREAFQLYYEKIKKGQFSLFVKGSLYAEQACIKAFFKDGWNLRVFGLGEEAEAFLLTSAATNSIHLGETEEAIYLSRRSIDWFLKNARWLEACVASAHLMSMLIASGELTRAREFFHEMEEVLFKTKNEVVLAAASSFDAYISFLEGDFEFAEEKFKESEAVFTKLIPKSPAPFPIISAYYCRFLIEMGKFNKALERSLLSFAWRKGKRWQAAIDTTPLLAGDMLMLGLAFLSLGDKVNAKKYLYQQVDLFRKADEWLYLPTGLNSRARFHAAVNDFDAALKDLNESIEVSRRTGAKFGEWEAQIDMAKLYIQQNNVDAARTSIQNAMKLPGMKNYRFRNCELSELSKKLALD